MILTGIKSPANTMIIVGFVFFGSGLLTGIWLFLKKKTSDVINVNGWQYKLFRKGNRFRFILISGLYKLHIVAITLLVIWFTVIQPDGDTSFNEILWYIAGSLIILIVLTPFLGYFEYKKFSSIDTGE
jgi:hypothetical protein